MELIEWFACGKDCPQCHIGPVRYRVSGIVNLNGANYDIRHYVCTFCNHEMFTRGLNNDRF